MIWTTRTRVMRFYREHVKEVTDIVEDIKEYISLEEKSGIWWGNCPFCLSEKTFAVTRARGGFFYCWRCHAGGGVFKFISMLDNISFWDAVRKIGRKHGISEEALKQYEKTNQESEAGNKSD